MIVAIAIRWHGVSDPHVAFHAMRHYRSAVIARSCYYDANPATPDWARAIARANRAIQPAGEPPIMEWAACGAYRLLGHEDLRVPRGLAALCWVLGTLPLFLLARRFMAPHGALLAAGLYLFLPYAIIATRTFQPDALMTMCILWAMWGMVRFQEHPDGRRLAMASLLGGAAVLVKPMAIFLVLPSTLSLGLTGPSSSPAARFRRTALLVALSLLPALLYYGYSLVFGTLARDQFQTRFVPSLLTTAFFWGGWAHKIGRVPGVIPFAAAVAGTLLARSAGLRRLLVSLWAGYAAFAVAFTYHVPTHDYYHLPYIAVTALGAAAAWDRWMIGRPIAARHWVATAMTAAVVAGVALWGSWRAAPRLTIPGAVALVADYERIGTATGHSPRILFLDLEYGYPLMYHGQMSGDAWPNTDDLAAEQIDGRRMRTAAERFEEDYADFHPQYFVVTDLHSLRVETDLQELLAARATLVEETPTYRVYRFKAS
jgi:4-amino-4-deoxy-L-arabinose transferase-like glycosyltransferase